MITNAQSLSLVGHNGRWEMAEAAILDRERNCWDGNYTLLADSVDTKSESSRSGYCSEVADVATPVLPTGSTRPESPLEEPAQLFRVSRLKPRMMLRSTHYGRGSL